MTDSVKRHKKRSSGDTLSKRMQVGAGILMLAIGVTLTAYAPFFSDGTSDGIKVATGALGNLLALAGGALLSWVIAATVSRRDAREELNEKLESLSRNLAVIYGRIMDAAQLGSRGAYVSEETALALIIQAADMINGQVTEIQAIRGNSFEGGILIETKEKLDDLSRKLARTESQGAQESVSLETSEVKALRNTVDAIRSDISRLQSGDAAGYTREDANCPNCGAVNGAFVGAAIGSTATRKCQACGIGFNIHRRADRTIFTRLVGPAPAGASANSVSEELTFNCTSCHKESKLRYSDRDGDSKLVICLKCQQGLQIEIPSGAVERSVSINKSVGTITGKYGARPTVTCPGCGESMRCVLRDYEKHEFLAFCDRDLNLIGVPESDFQEWRDQSEAS